jgi:hypothetical protein
MFNLPVAGCNCDTCSRIRKTEMARISEFDWCKETAFYDKEFLGWVYARLQANGDHWSMPHMKKLKTIIDNMVGSIPEKPKPVIVMDIINSEPVVIKRHGKEIYSENN